MVVLTLTLCRTAGGFGAGRGGDAASKSDDGVRATYALFAARVPGLNPTVAPSLFTYLEAA